jgi:hypothetical protein
MAAKLTVEIFLVSRLGGKKISAEVQKAAADNILQQM